MKVEREDYTEFKNVVYGEVFECDDSIYIKICNQEIKCIVNAVDLDTGETFLFRPNDEVRSLTSKLIIET